MNKLLIIVLLVGTWFMFPRHRPKKPGIEAWPSAAVAPTI
jgi:hypothetical protein